MIVVFDGLCNFCNGWVSFVIKRDSRMRFRFASAQSERGAKLLDQISPRPVSLESIVLIDGSRHFEKSDAVLRILGALDGHWPASRILLLAPKALRDACYSAFARHRYKLFGKSETCPVPDARVRDRFLF